MTASDEEKEQRRLAVLAEYDILDSAPDDEFDELTQLAADICGTPIALVSLIDRDRQWFKSRVGMDDQETPLENSFCALAVANHTAYTEVADAREHPVFHDYEAVTEGGVRFYAGALLSSPEGEALGTLCVVDHEPRELTPWQQRTLQVLARQVVHQLERRRAHRVIHREAEHLQSVIDHVPLMIGQLDHEGRYVFTNKRYRRWRGLGDGPLVGKHPCDVLPEPLKTEKWKRLRRCLGGESLHVVESGLPGQVLDVSYTPHETEKGEPGVFVVGQDITGIMQAEQTLRAHEQQLSSLYDLAPVGIVVSDLDTGVFVRANPEFARITGYQVRELLDCTPRYMTPEAWWDSDDAQRRTLLDVGRYGPYEKVYRHRDGHEVPVLLSGTLISNERGQRLIWSIVQDISERKRIEAMKTEFVSTVSHELRTPLTSIIGALGLATGGALGVLPEQLQSLLELAHGNSKRLKHLINDLLDIEKLAAGQMAFDMKPESLAPLVDQAIADNTLYARKYDVRLVSESGSEPLVAEVDSHRFQQILSNLLSNAIKFSPARGQVTVTLSQQGDKGIVAVTDHGPGIPLEAQGRLFERFFQVDASNTREKGGTGLGLAISRELAERMKGSLSVKSRKGEGATFLLELPLRSADASVSSESPAAATLHRRSDDPVLVLAEHPETGRKLVSLLDESGVEAHLVSRLADARRQLATGHYRALLLDTLESRSPLSALMDGFQAPAMPVIVVNASMSEGELRVAGSLAADGWLIKPVDTGELASAVREAIGRQGGSHRARILHIEDDEDLQTVLSLVGRELASFDCVQTVAAARQALASGHYDLVILDIDLPDGYGWSLLPDIHALNPPPAVVVLSGMDTPLPAQVQVDAILTKSRISDEEFRDTLTYYLGKQQSVKEAGESGERDDA